MYQCSGCHLGTWLLQKFVCVFLCVFADIRKVLYFSKKLLQVGLSQADNSNINTEMCTHWALAQEDLNYKPLLGNLKQLGNRSQLIIIKVCTFILMYYSFCQSRLLRCIKGDKDAHLLISLQRHFQCYLNALLVFVLRALLLLIPPIPLTPAEIKI